MYVKMFNNITNHMNYIKITRVKRFKDLEQFRLKILEETISNFLACNVEIFVNPLYQLKKYDINILDNQKRGFYPIDDDNVVILGRIMEDETMTFAIGIRIIKTGIKNSARFLTILEGALT